MDRLSPSSHHRIFTLSLLAFWICALGACSSTELIESPKTGFVAEVGTHDPQIVWTSRTLTRGFDYLGQVRARAWTYDGAIGRLVDGGKQLGADAIVDIHYERIGFINSMSAFAIKYK